MSESTNSFSKYTELMSELHTLIKTNVDDDRGDMLRDEMDAYWHRLTDDERQRAMELSERLYSHSHHVTNVPGQRRAH
ncbi:MAG: hypothetical protein HYV26_03350 [Candidatus Hydrogenedentes bacterium]|nr:hypothetical protein [Candidatus Hydrogenedentota bacterium]